MFYIRFTTKRPSQSSTEYIALPPEFVGQDKYYQIFENGRPLSGMWYRDLKVARKSLKMLPNELERLSNGWYKIELRNSRTVSIRDILGIRKHYDDGTTETITYVIRKIDIALDIAKNRNR